MQIETKGKSHIKEMVRPQAMVRIRVHTTVRSQAIPGFSAMGDSLIPGALVTEGGENEFVIYKSDLPKIEALIEHDQREVETSKDIFRKKLEAAQSNGAPLLSPTWCAEFVQRNLREPLPFTSVEVLEELPPPSTTEDVVEGRLAAMLKAQSAANREDILTLVRELVNAIRPDDAQTQTRKRQQ